jgi:hypothetical protein
LRRPIAKLARLATTRTMIMVATATKMLFPSCRQKSCRKKWSSVKTIRKFSKVGCAGQKRPAKESESGVSASITM